MRTFERLYIGGEWIEPAGTARLAVHSPTTEDEVGSVPDITPVDVDRAVAAATHAFHLGEWPALRPIDRAEYLLAVADALSTRADELADLLATEAGLPIATFARPEPAVGMLRYYASLAATYPFEELRAGDGADVLVRREPVGVVAAIVPWNSPIAIGFMKLAPLLLSGCTAVFKADPTTPLHAYVLAEVLEQAGLPPGVVNVLPAGREASAALVRHPDIDKVTFTGSTATGRTVAQACAADLKRVTLELGGKSAAVVLDDADLTTVLPGLVGTSMMNNGEACVLMSRVLAPRSRYDEVSEALAAAVEALPVGDPHDPATFVGPLITDDHRTTVESYITGAVDEGAKVLAGGGRPTGFDRGWFTLPTVVGNATNDMRIAREEVFGPVTAVIPYDDEDDAIALANDSEYGLSGTVWTGDLERGMEVARRIRTGNLGVNTFGMENTAPFGGYKRSGIGREKGPEGLDAYLELKSIHVPPGFDPRR